MCVACVGAASPEVAVVLGGYAAARFGRPVQRLKSMLNRAGPTPSLMPDETPESASATSEGSLRTP